MLILGIAFGLLLGLLLGGRIERLADVRLRYLPFLFAGVIVRFGTEAMLGFGVTIVDELRVPLLGLAYGLLLFTLWQNRAYPGLALAFVGVATNALVIMVNGGYMPVWVPAYQAAGLSGPMTTVLHTPLPLELGPKFLLELGPLADLIPIPLPYLNNVASIGDLFLTAGLSFFLFSTVLRAPEETRRAIDEARTGRSLGIAGTARLPAAPGAPTAPPAGTGRVGDALVGTAIADTSGWSHFPPGEAVTPVAIQAGTGLDAGPCGSLDPRATAHAGRWRRGHGVARARAAAIRGHRGDPCGRGRLHAGGGGRLCDRHRRPGHPRGPSPIAARGDPRAPVHPARPQRLVLRPVGRPAHQPVR